MSFFNIFSLGKLDKELEHHLFQTPLIYHISVAAQNSYFLDYLNYLSHILLAELLVKQTGEKVLVFCQIEN